MSLSLIAALRHHWRIRRADRLIRRLQSEKEAERFQGCWRALALNLTGKLWHDRTRRF